MVGQEVGLRTREIIWKWIKVGLVLSLMVALWAFSYLFATVALWLGIPGPKDSAGMGDMATLLFGASSVALFTFSFIIGVLAIFGWEALKKAVEASTQKRIDALEAQLRGRVIGAIGLMIGVLHSEPDKLNQSVNNRDYLSEAVVHCRKAYKILKDVQGTSKYMALNNFIYYSSLLDEPGSGGELLRLAPELKNVGYDYNFPEALLSYCRVILQFSDDTQQVKGALSIAEGLRSRKDISKRQRDEVAFYATSLEKKLNPPTTKSQVQ